MRAVLIALAVLAVLAAISLFGLFGIGTPLATAAITLVPATFMVSLVIGFASRRRSWFG
jgi:thiol:disulfide interchange protein